MPSSDHSTKCSNLDAEQTHFLVFTILSNIVKDCIIDINLLLVWFFLFYFPTLLICIHGCASVLPETTITVFVFYQIDIANLMKNLSMSPNLMSY